MNTTTTVKNETKNVSLISEKLIALVKRFTKIEADQKDLDYRKAQWAAEARGCFRDDRQFVNWCKSDLGITDAAAQDLALMARAAGIVPDAKMWNQLGGSRQIRAVENLTKSQQVNILEQAKVTGRAVRTLVRERFPANNEYLPSVKPPKMDDVATLAHFIAENINRLPKLPGHIDALVRMYVPGLK